MNEIKCIFAVNVLSFPNEQAENYIDITEEISIIGSEDYPLLKEDIWSRTEDGVLYYVKSTPFPPGLGVCININYIIYRITDVEFYLDKGFIYYSAKFKG